MVYPRYLTKSLFKLGLDCSAKLYYKGKREIYADKTIDDPFMNALAEGGFQVGELAKLYFEGGYQLDTLDPAIALNRTNELLQEKDIIIYEAAFRYNQLFVRADIIEKKAGNLDLIEVKAKSFDPVKDDFITKSGRLRSDWEAYLFDIAFQYYVISKSRPDLTIKPYLFLADKTAAASIDGLNQYFKIEKKEAEQKPACPGH